MDEGATSSSLPTMPADGAPASDQPAQLPDQPQARPGGRRRAPGRGAGQGGRRWLAWGWVPLAGVLVVQALLSLRLVRADTAFQDEALYLWAGHREWAHWLHGVPLPPFSAYFSGAPVLYPPLGALADSAGGLAGARTLSLAFMLGATTLAWATTTRLYGRRAAFFAAALFAITGPTLHLGAFATYDALSILLIALAAWCAVRAADRPDATGWMLAAGIALALANATAYSTVLLDPVVVVLAYLVACPRPGGKTALARAATLLTVTVALLVAGALIGGGSYLTGIRQTTFGRVGGADSVLSVLDGAWSWTGLIVVVAVIGAILSYARYGGRPQTWLLALLAAAALLAPLDQAVLHTVASLNKHVDAGAWFAAIAAGYAAEQFIASAHDRRTQNAVCALCGVALILPVTIGLSQARAFSTAWPNSASFIAIFGPLADHGTGRLLVEDPSIAEYYLPAGARWQRWSSTRNIVLPSGASTGGPSRAAGVVGDGDPAAFARFVSRGYFSLVALNFADTTDLDLAIRADLHADRYRIVQVVPYGSGTYVIFARESRS